MTIKTTGRIVLAAALLGLGTAAAAQMSSTNYQIKWDATDSGGGTAMSTNYTLMDSIGQSTPVGISMSASYTLSAGFEAPPDGDSDSVRDFLDNCTNEANADQRDTNSDGFGNICDPDLNNDGIVNAIDLGLFKLVFFTTDPDADFNGDGVVNPIDLGRLKLYFFLPPGPSGIN